MKTRYYHLQAVNIKTGAATRLSKYAMTHAQACVNKSKFSDHPLRRVELVEADITDERL